MPELEANRRPIASRSAGWAKALAAFLARTSVTPNQISAVSVVFAAVGAGLLAFKPDRDRPYRLRRCGSGPARLQSPRRHGGDRGRQEIVGRGALQRVSRPHRRYLCSSSPWAMPRLAGARLVGALAAALTAYVRVFGGSLGFAQDFRGPMAKQQRMAALTAPASSAVEWLFTGTQYALIAAAHHRRRSVVTCVTRTLAIARRAQGKLACGCRIS